ncbi:MULTISPECIES: O-methyltransferase [Oceanobacillus]|uniref:tRNA 5-hydroxyuridine methyltransferase n=2 Tax=Oceanobacillus TaxID=182709 RepID=A0A0A1MW95_9BACI|nr:O-methyltransferase [Oceanobacillus oncorhynchi]MDM8100412.1 O-methyltransferase [Oceanobacillus oncorhynchi]UUI38183.1 O-methyltransferase [Oceanobacillus oncorhynchi]CEI83844.1 Protein-L-isoaspartate O-methyltransferase [Oceanobacillus oncorhynchi]
MEKDIESYLENLLPASSGAADVLEKYAEINHVPIINRSSMHMINLILKMKQPEKILEVGTAIGYSALRMLEGASKANIVTIEKDANRYQEAITNIKEQKRDNQIEVIFGDAAEVMQELAEKKLQYDVIFIDAAKGQYQVYFDLADKMLMPGGVLITDNVLFRGMVFSNEEVPKKYKTLVRKLRSYNEMLVNHPDYHTSIIPMDDGVSISYKK